MVIFAARFGFEFREQLQDLVALRVAKTIQGLMTRLEALGPGPVGQDDLVLVEHEVDVARAVRFHTVHPGQTVRLTFQNTATNPAMSHNVVVLAQGASVNDVGQAAMSAADSDYIPAEFSDQILAHTAMAAPGETVTVEFTAPAEGEYTYVCTFPGHYMMMQGTMRVVAA